MICWGGFSFVTVAASGWQMVVRYESSGGNLLPKGGGEREGRGGERECRGIDRERTRVRGRSCERLRFEGTRTVQYLAAGIDERGKRRER